MCVEVEDVNAFSRDCMTGERYGIGWIWQELDLRSASKDLQPCDSGTVWQILETGQKKLYFQEMDVAQGILSSFSGKDLV